MNQAHPNRLLKQIELLKMKLVNAEDFYEIQTHFMEKLADDREFMQLGKLKRHKQLEQVIALAVQKGLNFPTVTMQNMFFMQLPKQHFTHGTGLINGIAATYFYFSDIDVGLLTLYASPRTGGEMRMIRFSIRVMGSNPAPSPN